jgi:hypothetical protein
VLSKVPDESGSIFSAIFPKLLEAIHALPEVFLRDSFLPALQSLLQSAPFSAEFWAILSHSRNELREEFAQITKILCFKDCGLFESRMEIVAELVRMMQADVEAGESDAPFIIMVGLCLRASPGHPAVAALIPDFLAVLMPEIENGQVEAVEAADALAIFGSDLVARTLGDAFAEFAEFVLETPRYDISPIAVIRLFDLLSQELRIRAVGHIVGFLRSAIGEEEDDDELDDGVRLPWFFAEELKSQAIAFVRKTAETDPELLCALEEEGAGLLSCLFSNMSSE